MSKKKQEEPLITRLTKENTNLRKKVSDLEAKVKDLEYMETHWVDAKSIVSLLLKPCEKCGVRMLTLDWSGGRFISTCNNMRCSGYRTPVGGIDKKVIEELGIKI